MPLTIYPQDLCHYGVKGMRWGVRRTDARSGRKPRSSYTYRVGDVTLKRGTKFQRIAGSSNLDYTKGVYTSYKISDMDLYKGVLGRMRITKMLKENGDVTLKELSMTANKDITR